MEEHNYTVYMHICPNDKKYIGITKQKPIKRWGYNGINYKKQKLFYRAICKYGWSNIKHLILFTNLTKEEAENKEIELIKHYKSNNVQYGYNIDNGGNIIGSFSKEHREKISKALKNKEKSKEAIEKMRISKMGKPAWNKGKHNIYTKEQLLKMSKATKELWKNEKYREKNCKKVLCVELNIIFNSVNEAKRYFNISSSSHISECCNGKLKSCGKYNGKKLHWKYI